MDKENYLIYEGVFFRIEWFYDKAGYSQVFEYFRKTSPSQKRKFLMLVKKIGDFGKIFDKTRNIAQVGEFLINIGGGIPNDLENGEFVEFHVRRIDIY